MSESKAPPDDDCLPVSSPSSSVAGEEAADAGMMMMGTATSLAPHCHSLSASLISTAANCERDAVKPASDMEEGRAEDAYLGGGRGPRGQGSWRRGGPLLRLSRSSSHIKVERPPVSMRASWLGAASITPFASRIKVTWPNKMPQQ